MDSSQSGLDAVLMGALFPRRQDIDDTFVDLKLDLELDLDDDDAYYAAFELVYAAPEELATTEFERTADAGDTTKTPLVEPEDVRDTSHDHIVTVKTPRIALDAASYDQAITVKVPREPAVYSAPYEKIEVVEMAAAPIVNRPARPASVPPQVPQKIEVVEVAPPAPPVPIVNRPSRPATVPPQLPQVVEVAPPAPTAPIVNRPSRPATVPPPIPQPRIAKGTSPAPRIASAALPRIARGTSAPPTRMPAGTPSAPFAPIGRPPGVPMAPSFIHTETKPGVVAPTPIERIDLTAEARSELDELNELNEIDEAMRAAFAPSDAATTLNAMIAQPSSSTPAIAQPSSSTPAIAQPSSSTPASAQPSSFTPAIAQPSSSTRNAMVAQPSSSSASLARVDIDIDVADLDEVPPVDPPSAPYERIDVAADFTPTPNALPFPLYSVPFERVDLGVVRAPIWHEPTEIISAPPSKAARVIAIVIVLTGALLLGVAITLFAM